MQSMFRVVLALGALALVSGVQAQSAGPSIVQPGVNSNGKLDMVIPADGLPLVVYQDGATVKALKCGNANCSSGNLLTTLANLSVRRIRVALGSDGLPLVGMSVSSSGLRMARCHDAGCSTATINVVDPANLGSNPDHAFMVPPDGRPIFAIFDHSNLDLKVARCADATCTSSQITVVDSTGTTGSAPSITLVAGLPQISYIATTLKLARCATLACDTGTTILPLAADNAAETATITGRDGFAMIFYKHDVATQDAVRLVKCGNALCSTTTASLLDSTNLGGGLGSGLQARTGADGLPLAAYFDVSFSAVKLLRCTRQDCAAATTTTVHAPAQSMLVVGAATALGISANGTPALAYTLSAINGLTLSFCNTRSCL